MHGEYGIVRANSSSEPIFQELTLYLQCVRIILNIGTYICKCFLLSGFEFMMPCK